MKRTGKKRERWATEEQKWASITIPNERNDDWSSSHFILEMKMCYLCEYGFWRSKRNVCNLLRAKVVKEFFQVKEEKKQHTPINMFAQKKLLCSECAHICTSRTLENWASQLCMFVCIDTKRSLKCTWNRMANTLHLCSVSRETLNLPRVRLFLCLLWWDWKLCHIITNAKSTQ